LRLTFFSDFLSYKKIGNRQEGFEPSAVHAGKTNKALLPVFESLAETILNITLAYNEVNYF